MRKSISVATTRAKVATTSMGLRRRKLGCTRSIHSAVHKNNSRSRAKARSMPGRRIFTATSRCVVMPVFIDVLHDGEMHLRDRSGGDRRLVEGDEDGFQRLVELARDGGLGFGGGKGGQAVLQPRQIVGDISADQIGARRQRFARA